MKMMERMFKAKLKGAGRPGLGTVLKMGNSFISAMSGLLAVTMMLYSGIVLYDTFFTQVSASSAYDLLNVKAELIDDELMPLSGGKLLYTLNDDHRAWLTLDDTNVDYPVMQGKDDLFYATHDIYGKVSLTGAIYLAAGNEGDLSDSYNLVYGHHMDGKAMFGALDDYMDQDFLEEHREGIIVTPDKAYDIYVFGVITTDAYENRIYFVGDRMEQVTGFLRAMNENSDGKTKVLFLDEAALEGAEKIVALSTCRSAETSGRLVIFAVMTEHSEDDPGNDPIPGSTPEDPDPDPSEDPSKDPEDPYEEIDDGPAPKSHGMAAWAFVNLICTIIAAYMFLPLLHLRAKYGRKKAMKEFNEEKELLKTLEDPSEEEAKERDLIYDFAVEEKEKEEDRTVTREEITEDDYKDAVEKIFYHVKKFAKSFRFGFIVEILMVIGAIVTFILTENMRLPMVLVDRWTPLMIIFMVICWAADIKFMRYREKFIELEEKEEE